MKLIWHIVKKDTLRDRWALLTWALLFVGQDAIGVFARHSAVIDSRRAFYLQVASGGLVFLQMIMGYILVSRLVQADALIGTTMFWPTRPISATRLFLAKLLNALLIFGLLPVLLLLPWWLYCQFGWREILWSSVDTLGWQLLMIAPAFLVASLTDDLGRVLLWTLLLVIGGMSWIILQSSVYNRMAQVPAGVSIMYTRFWLSGLILVVGSLAIAAYQYLTRRFLRSVGLVVFALGLIALIGEVWPWNWAKVIGELHRPAPVAPAPVLMDGLTVTVAPSAGSFNRDRRLKADGTVNEAYLNPGFRVRGLPDEMGIVAENVEQTWTWPNGLHLGRRSTFNSGGNLSRLAVLRRTYSLPVPAEDPETKQWQQAERDRIDARLKAHGLHVHRLRVLPLGPGEVLMNGYTSVPNSFLAKMRAEPPAYAAKAEFGLYRPEIVTTLPLKAGARTSGRSQTYQFREIKNGTALVVMTSPSVTKAGLWGSAAMSDNWLFQDPPSAVNERTGDIGWVSDNQTGSQYLYIGGVIVHWNFLQIITSRVIRGGKWEEPDPQWPQHTTLVFLANKPAGQFTRELKSDRYTVETNREEAGDGAASEAASAVSPKTEEPKAGEPAQTNRLP